MDAGTAGTASDSARPTLPDPLEDPAWPAHAPLWRREVLTMHVRDLLPSRGAVGALLWLRWPDTMGAVVATSRALAEQAHDVGDLVITPAELLATTLLGEAGRLDAAEAVELKRRGQRWDPRRWDLGADPSDAPNESETWWPGADGLCPGHWMRGGWTVGRWLHALGADLEAAHVEGEPEPARWAEELRF